MREGSLINSTLSTVAAKESVSALSTAQVLLSSLGFEDQQAAIQIENAAQIESEQALRSAIKEYEAKPEPKQRSILLKILDSEIKHVTAEYNQALANQKKFERLSLEAANQVRLNYLGRFGNWILNNVKYFFGSDADYLVEYYKKISVNKSIKMAHLKRLQKQLQSVLSDANKKTLNPLKKKLSAISYSDEIKVNEVSGSMDNFRLMLASQSNGNFFPAWLDLGYPNTRSLNNSGFPHNLSPYQFSSSVVRYSHLHFKNDNTGIITGESSGSSPNPDVFAQRLSSGGVPFGSSVQVNTYTVGQQENPVSTSQSTGEIVFVWESAGLQDGSGRGIYARRFAADLSPLTSESRVNTHTPNDQILPVIGLQPNNNLIVGWQSLDQDGDDWGIYARLYRYDLASLTSPFLVNNHTVSSQQYPAIGVQSTGRFIFIWQSSFQDGDDDGIYAQAFNSDASRRGNEFLVNKYTLNFQRFPSIAILQNDEWVGSWWGAGTEGNLEVYAQRFSADCIPIGTAFRVNNGPSLYQVRYVPMRTLSNNHIAFIWLRDAGLGNGSSDVYVRIIGFESFSNSTVSSSSGTTGTYLISSTASDSSSAEALSLTGRSSTVESSTTENTGSNSGGTGLRTQTGGNSLRSSSSSTGNAVSNNSETHVDEGLSLGARLGIGLGIGFPLLLVGGYGMYRYKKNKSKDNKCCQFFAKPKNDSGLPQFGNEVIQELKGSPASVEIAVLKPALVTEQISNNQESSANFQTHRQYPLFARLEKWGILKPIDWSKNLGDRLNDFSRDLEKDINDEKLMTIMDQHSQLFRNYKETLRLSLVGDDYQILKGTNFFKDLKTAHLKSKIDIAANNDNVIMPNFH